MSRALSSNSRNGSSVSERLPRGCARGRDRGVVILSGAGESVGIRGDGGIVVLGLFKNARVIAAVEINVGFDEEVAGEETAGITEDHFNRCSFVAEVRLTRGELRLDHHSQ